MLVNQGLRKTNATWSSEFEMCRRERRGVENRARLGVRGVERRLEGAGGVHSCWVDDEMRDVKIIGSVV